AHVQPLTLPCHWVGWLRSARSANSRWWRMTSNPSQPSIRAQETPAALVARLRATFHSGCTRPLAYRHRQLAGLAHFLREQESAIEQALHDDLGKPSVEALTSEIAYPAREVALARKKLSAWAKWE